MIGADGSFRRIHLVIVLFTVKDSFDGQSPAIRDVSEKATLTGESRLTVMPYSRCA